MEIFLLTVAIIIGLLFALPALSSRKTKLFRRVHHATYLGKYDDRNEALNEIYLSFGIINPNGELTPNEQLCGSLPKMTEEALEYDHKHRINQGIRVLPILAIDIKSKLNNSGINQFDETLNMLTHVDMIALASAVEKNLPKSAADIHQLSNELSVNTKKE